MAHRCRDDNKLLTVLDVGDGGSARGWAADPWVKCERVVDAKCRILYGVQVGVAHCSTHGAESNAVMPRRKKN